MMIDNIIFSFRNIFRKGLRTTLTILGIAVGVASVLLINTISNVGIKTVNYELDSLGLNGISISADKADLKNSDLNFIKSQEGVKDAIPILTSKATVSQNDFTEDVMLWGVDSGVKQVISIDILYGESFNKYQILSKENVCLLDENAANKIFKRKNAIGKFLNISVGNTFEKYKIIGITKAGSGMLQSVMGNFIPNFCYIPYSTFQQSIGTDELYQIAVRINENTETDVISTSIKNAVDNEKGIKDSIKIGDLAAGRSTLSSLLNTITIIFSAVGIITLLVAGLGIMTVMLVSVNERTREIGIKKALGATMNTILNEFLFEALTICVLGSIIGSSFGLIIIKLGENLFNISAEISLLSIIVSFSSAILTGVVFGIYPAYKAAKMKPVDALRYE